MVTFHNLLPGSQTIEKIAKNINQGCYRSVLFDFDGTLSLIRQG